MVDLCYEYVRRREDVQNDRIAEVKGLILYSGFNSW